MSYTLEQKREAFEHRQLWWRFPKSASGMMREWSLINDDFDGGVPSDAALQRTSAEYSIGPTSPAAPTAPTPPRVLSDLEGELLEALKGLDEAYCRAGSPLTRDERTEDRKRLIAARAAIQKAEAQQ